MKYLLFITSILLFISLFFISCRKEVTEPPSLQFTINSPIYVKDAAYIPYRTEKPFSIGYISVIDLDTNKEAGIINLPAGVVSLDFPKGNDYIFATSFNFEIMLINIHTNQYEKTIKFNGLSPAYLKASNDGSTIYFSSPRHKIGVLDTHTLQLVKSIDLSTPLTNKTHLSLLDVSSDNKYLAVLGSHPDTLLGGNKVALLVDLQTDSVISVFPVGVFPNALLFSSDGRKLYADAAGAQLPSIIPPTLTIIDVVNRELLKKVILPVPHLGDDFVGKASINVFSQRLYISYNPTENTSGKLGFFIWDIVSDTLVKTVSTQFSRGIIAAGNNDRTLYISPDEIEKIYIFDLEVEKVIKEISLTPVSQLPYAIFTEGTIFLP